MKLTLGERVLDFRSAAIKFSDCCSTDVFGTKNNKTLRQTLLHPKYASLAQSVLQVYPDSLEQGLGDFLLELNRCNDPFYLRFLNRYGDACYCEFRIQDSNIQRLRGLYCFTVDGTLTYTEKSTDSFARRINQGYQAEGDELPTVYIGEGDVIRNRIESRFQNKDFWNRAIVFTASNNCLNKAHVKWLEYALVNRASEAKQSILDNGTKPQEPGICEAERVPPRQALK